MRKKDSLKANYRWIFRNIIALPYELKLYNYFDIVWAERFLMECLWALYSIQLAKYVVTVVCLFKFRGKKFLLFNFAT